ncbi:hypothetical protein SK128_021510 [Halocaridina rubra]|uniref:Major facilitator superfamily (MFS) profile domain-containing protein n=1 Tax=Halocaridina rubra TaxID=373956 RepID=A0AAN8XL72_HALRR
MRMNLSIAIVAMVNRGTEQKHASNLTGNCPFPNNTDTISENNQVVGEFQWDERMQGLLLGAYFYGNIATNMIGGRVAEYTGGKRVLGVSVLLSSVFALLSPVAARFSTNLFVTVRLLTGLAQGFAMPAVTRCLVVWIPSLERSKFNTVVFSGAELGIVLTLSTGGWLCGLTFLGGWPLVFYIFGGLGILWCLLWFLLHTEKPENHPRISTREKEYILEHCKVKRGKFSFCIVRRYGDNQKWRQHSSLCDDIWTTKTSWKIN